MLELIDSLPTGVLGLRASGRVTAEDYATVDAVLAAMDPAVPLRMLLEISPEFRRFATTCFWEHPRCGLYRLRAGDRLAVLAKEAWLRQLADHAGLRSGELRCFPLVDAEAAIDWLLRA